MKAVLPILIICGIGIAACIAYIVFLCVKSLQRRPPRKREFEIEEDSLTVKLKRRKR